MDVLLRMANVERNERALRVARERLAHNTEADHASHPVRLPKTAAESDLSFIPRLTNYPYTR